MSEAPPRQAGVLAHGEGGPRVSTHDGDRHRHGTVGGEAGDGDGGAGRLVYSEEELLGGIILGDLLQGLLPLPLVPLLGGAARGKERRLGWAIGDAGNKPAGPSESPTRTRVAGISSCQERLAYTCMIVTPHRPYLWFRVGGLTLWLS